MPKLIVRGAEICKCELCDDEGGVFVRINVKANYTDVLARQMGWADSHDDLKKGDLKGKMRVNHFTITPNDKELQKHELQLNAVEVGKFTLSVTGENPDEGKTGVTHVKFQMRTESPDAEAMLGKWKRKIGRAPALMKIDYPKQQQMELGEDGAA